MSETQQGADIPIGLDSALDDAVSTEAAPAAARAGTVGRQLRQAREAAGLSVQDTAQSIKYSPRQIELIEADNYAALPGVTVVRGFVRSYARFLRLDVDALLGMLDERLPKVAADVRPPDNMGAASEPGDGRDLSLLATLAIVVALAALLLALWHFFGPSPAKPASSSTQVAPAAVSSPAPAAVEPQVLPQPVASPSAVETVERAAVSPAVPAAVAPQLVFVFSGRSWVEVSDATKKLIHTGENVAGSELRLDGLPPFDIVVGNAPKVKLSFGERQIDLAPHTRAEVARLKVE